MFQVDFKDSLPKTSQNPQISFEILTQSDDIKSLNVGDSSQQLIKIKNLSQQPQGMVIFQLSIPSCLKINFEFLETLKDLKKIDNFEILPQSIVLYFTYLKKDEEI